MKLPKKRILKYDHPDLALIHCLDYHQPSFALKYRPLKIKRIFCIHLKHCYAAQPIGQSISRSSNTISVKMHFNLCPATHAAAQIANPITHLILNLPNTREKQAKSKISSLFQKFKRR